MDKKKLDRGGSRTINNNIYDQKFDYKATDSDTFKVIGNLSESEYDSLPFKPFDQTLSNVLRKQYIYKVANWLLGKRKNSILAEESNSNWEAALTIMYFENVKKILEDHNEKNELHFYDKIASICMSVANRLTINKIETDHLYCWDKVTWDTAVVLRALLITYRNHKDKFQLSEKKSLEDCFNKAFPWLFKTFESWEFEKYPLGPADVAQILITTLYLKDNFPKIFQEIENTYDFENNEYPIEQQLCNYLLREKTSYTKVINGNKENISSWIDYFQTAEILDALISYCSYLKLKKRKTKIEKEIEAKILKTCRETVRFFELEQSETGTWGNIIDTLRSLSAYVRATYELGYSPEPHLVFKALRWICDQKQRFSDGSFQHTLFLTIFMCDSFIEIHNKWEYSDSPIVKLYDDVLWSSPMRTSPERAKRIAAEIEKERINNEVQVILNKEKILFTIISFLLTLELIIFISTFLNILVINGNIKEFAIKDLTNFVAITGIAIGLYTTILFRIFSKNV